MTSLGTGLGKPRCFRPAAGWLVAAALSTMADVAIAGDRLAGATADAVPPAPQQFQQPQQGGPAAPGAGSSPRVVTFPPQPPAPERGGFFRELGRWWDGSVSFFGDRMKDARGRIDDMNRSSRDAAQGAVVATGNAMKSAAEATKGAATAIVRLPGTRVFEIHARCEPAANGAPNCPAAAEAACRARGFTSGRPLDVSTAEVCPPASFRTARAPVGDDCPIESVVLRAVCQ